MKCQHCGINFDDSERACPMCGARAGSRGRLGAGPARAVRARGTAPERESYADYVSAKVTGCMGGEYRMVCHYGVTRADCETTAQLVRQFAAEG